MTLPRSALECGVVFLFRKGLRKSAISLALREALLYLFLSDRTPLFAYFVSAGLLTPLLHSEKISTSN
jgi:hypothetical protein